MSYFSNGSEGEALDNLCYRCIHGYDKDGMNKTDAGCNVAALQMIWNYEQQSREDHGTITVKRGNITSTNQIGEFTREAVVKKYALDLLVPGNPDNDNPQRFCTMFIEDTEV